MGVSLCAAEYRHCPTSSRFDVIVACRPQVVEDGVESGWPSGVAREVAALTAVSRIREVLGHDEAVVCSETAFLVEQSPDTLSCAVAHIDLSQGTRFALSRLESR